MNLGRIFANAVARRFAFVVVAFVLGWLGLGQAQAQAVSQGQAYLQCMVAAEASVNVSPNQRRAGKCLLSGSSFNCTFDYRYSFGGGNFGEWMPDWGWCGAYPFDGSLLCSNRPTSTTLFYPPSGSVACDNGCEVKYRESGDGETTQRSPTGTACNEKPDCGALSGNYIWNGYLNVCQPVQPECPEGQTAHGSECVKDDSCPDGMALKNGVCTQKEDTCPPGNIKSPEGACLPGDGQCAAGEARRANGTCGKDKDGDGEADDDDDDPDNDTEKPEASGGDSCETPPSCSGDAIACMQVKIQWRIDCNTRKKANVSGGHCGAGGMPVCAGEGCDEREHQQLIQQWKSACALEKLLAKDGQTGTGDQPNWTKVTGTGKEGEGEDPEGPVTDKEFDPTGRLDFSGFTGGGTCPQLGVLKLPFGVVFDMNSKPWFCDLLYMTRVFLALLGSFIGLGIILGWRS